MDVTIIICVYNGEEHIINALESIKNAKNSEKVKVIVVNDGSTDETMNILKNYEMENLKIIDLEENVRPGIARNMAIEMVDTEYLMILDADDELRYSIFSELSNYEEKKYDVIKFSHMYKKGDTIFFDKLPEYNYGEYFNEEIEILATDNFYSCGRLFRTKFIQENNIKYSEKIYYEDINFVIGAYTKAKTALIISNVFVQINIKENSATREKFEDDFHIQSINQAIIEAFSNNSFKNKEIENQVWMQLANKAVAYLNKKCPEEYLNSSSEKVFSTLRKYSPKVSFDNKYLLAENGFSDVELIRTGIVKNIEELNNQKMFKLPTDVYNFRVNKNNINSKKTREKLQKKYDINTNYAYVKYFEEAYKKEEDREIILFMGFDFAFRGNSKYKFIEECYKGKEVYFVTKDPIIPQKFRIQPYSNEYYFLLAHADIVYLESYVDQKFTIGNNTKVIQLWHGTPMKKLLLDSNEKYFTGKNPGHKTAKLNLIQKFENFCVYNEFEEEKMISAFNLKKEQVCRAQNSRINFLKENVNKISMFKEKYEIPDDKKIIAYVPTWRDYSFVEKLPYGITTEFFEMLRSENKKEILYSLYKQSIVDMNENNLKFEEIFKDCVCEKIDKENLSINELEMISDYYYDLFTDEFIEKYGYKNGNYHVLIKPHQFTNLNFIDKLVNETINIETQELILISDICISDYSSIIFDYFEINKPVYLLWDDLELFENYRGIYPEIAKDFKDIIANDQEGLYELIKNDVRIEVDNKYLNISEFYQQ